MPRGLLGFRRLTTLGPLVKENDSKEVVGIAGTPYPNRPKSDLVLTYILGGYTRPFINVRDAADDIQRKVDSRVSGTDVTVLKSGRGSQKMYGGERLFDGQGVVVRIFGSRLPITETNLSKIDGVIQRKLEQVNEELDDADGVFIEDVIFDNT